MRFFGNDQEGFTMLDFLSLIVVMTTILLIFISVFFPFYRDPIGSALCYLKIPFWTVLGFYFGTGAILSTIPIAQKTYAKIKTMIINK